MSVDLYNSIFQARQRGASDDAILSELTKQNPDKTSFQEALNRGATSEKIMEQVIGQNKPSFVDRVKLSFGGKSAQQKRMAIDAIESGVSKGDIADIIGDIPATVGMIGGGILAAPGVVTTPLGAGAGAAAGETVRQQIGNLLGVRTEEEGLTDVKDIATEGALGVAAEVGGKATVKLLQIGTAKLAVPLLEKWSSLPEKSLNDVFFKSGVDTTKDVVGRSPLTGRFMKNKEVIVDNLLNFIKKESLGAGEKEGTREALNKAFIKKNILFQKVSPIAFGEQTSKEINEAATKKAFELFDTLHPDLFNQSIVRSMMDDAVTFASGFTNPAQAMKNIFKGAAIAGSYVANPLLGILSTLSANPTITSRTFYTLGRMYPIFNKLSEPMKRLFITTLFLSANNAEQ